MNKKYRTSIFIAVFILCGIIIFSISFLTHMQTLTNTSILKNLGEITKQDVEKLENKIKEHMESLQLIINEINTKNLKSEQDIFDIYNNSIKKEEFSRIAVLYKNGKTSTSDAKIVDLSEDIEDFFSSQDIQISKSRISKVNHEEINIYSKKIQLLDEEVVILLVIDNEKYKQIFTQNIYEGNGIECIITNTGEIIANSKNQENGRNLFTALKTLNKKEEKEIENMKKDILEGQEGEQVYSLNKHTYYMSYRKLNIKEWVLVVIIPGNIIAEELNQLAKIITTILLGIMCIAFIMIIYILISKVKKKEELYKLAFIDPITKLGNYNFYIKEIKENLDKDGKKVMMIIDIDRFKSFNKKYGHQLGNKLLKKIGEEIKASLRKQDIVCRLANDVFGIMILGDVNIDSIAKRMKEHIFQIYIQDKRFQIQISIGIYVINKDEENVQSIIDKTIIAHDSVKGKYNELYGIFTEEMEQKIIRESEIESEVIQAIEKEEFEIYYQPQISTLNEKIEGAEALVRWNKNGIIISPGEFIPILEKNFFIIELEKYIYKRVCKDLQELKKELTNIPKISVNISKQSLLEENFIEEYMEITNKYKIQPKEIEFEITERTTVDRYSTVKEILIQLKNKGFSIAIDDFGTGYSSLNVLGFLPIDTLKIDKSFIDSINNSSNEVNLIDTILLITRKLHLKTIAEGVENIEQVTYLKKINCDLIQGYFYSRPLNLEAFKIYITDK